jgi:N-acetylmuramoyl-L-alanine amidase
MNFLKQLLALILKLPRCPETDTNQDTDQPNEKEQIMPNQDITIILDNGHGGIIDGIYQPKVKDLLSQKTDFNILKVLEIERL